MEEQELTAGTKNKQPSTKIISC